MKAKEVSFDFKRGDTQTLRFGVLTKDGSPLKLGLTDEIFFTIRVNEDAKNIILQKKYSNGTLKYEDGYVVVKLTHRDTNDLEPITYRYDIQVDLNNKDFVGTVFEGDIDLGKDVTRE